MTCVALGSLGRAGGRARVNMGAVCFLHATRELGAGDHLLVLPIQVRAPETAAERGPVDLSGTKRPDRGRCSTADRRTRNAVLVFSERCPREGGAARGGRKARLAALGIHRHVAGRLLDFGLYNDLGRAADGGGGGAKRAELEAVEGALEMQDNKHRGVE